MDPREEGRARLAPKPRISSGEQLEDIWNQRLKKYGLSHDADFVIVVEGTTDRDYLCKAAELVRDRHHVDLLVVPEGVRRGNSCRIAIETPTLGATQRGGVPCMVSLAEQICEFCVTLQFVQGIVFVFDYDEEGKSGVKRVEECGFPRGNHTLLIEPGKYPRVQAREIMTVESLLSLRIQQEFFDTGSAWCSVEYQRGTMVGFKWHNKSKAALRDHVCKKATLDDLIEVARLLSHVRATWGFNDDPAIFTL